MNLNTISCIIPAHNEQDRITRVLDAAVQSDLFASIVVIDDASWDYTAWAARDYLSKHKKTEARVINLLSRRGKCGAVAHGFSNLPKSRYICLLDADLMGLTPHDLIALVTPVLNGDAGASISRRRKGSGLWPGLDILSGERVIPWWVLDAVKFQHCRAMGMEMAINDILISARSSIAVVHWPGVTNPTKRQKYGFWEGMKEEAGMYRDLMVGDGGGLWAMARQCRRLNQQVVEG
jgi:glycosyltransferase involved in cell wall biosynthesis